MLQELTIEQVSRRSVPAWLVEHSLAQSLDARSIDAGGPSRIIVIHSSSAALDEFLDTLAADCPVIDRTSHQTLQGLARKLHADLRQPRLLSAGGATGLSLDAVMAELATELRFPILHPIPDMHWSSGKSAIMLEMFSALQQECVFDEWDGPGADGVERAIIRIEEALQGRHPDRHLSVLCDLLESATEKPFSLVGFQGIILLDRPPNGPKIEARFLQSLLRHLPIHQLCYAGSHRLGKHGWTLQDIHPLTADNPFPKWLPEHRLESPDSLDSTVATTSDSGVHRVLLQRAAHAIPVTTRLLKQHLTSEGSAIIIDPALESNREKWNTSLAAAGVAVPRGARPLCSSPFVHWVERTAELSHGEGAFDLERLRSLSVQQVLQPFDAGKLGEHPSIEQIRPIADSDMLEQIARDNHLLPGPGALRRWLQALSREIDENARGAQRREATQWWLLSIARSLRPLLRDEDRAAIDEASYAVGCLSREILPLPETTSSGDAWLRRLLRNVDRSRLVQRFDGSEDLAMRGLQQLFGMVEAHRVDQAAIGLSSPNGGHAWVEELVALIADSELAAPISSRGRVRLLKPNEALGCSAELIILANVDAESWSMRVPKIPLLDEERRAELDILRPDGPIRAARHHLTHLMAAGRTTIILDPSLDESAPPAAPIAEWLRALPIGTIEEPLRSPPPNQIDSDDIAAIGESAATRGWQWQEIERREEITALVHQTDLVVEAGDARIEEYVHGVEARDQRQRDGIKIQSGRTPERVPLAIAGLSTPFDYRLMADRIARQPSHLAEDACYLDATERDRIVTVNPLKMVPKSKDPKGAVAPRNAPDWPPIGGRLPDGKETMTMTIDPRPLRPHPVGLDTLDRRSGAAGRPIGRDPTWSPSGLRKWQDCPRQGWLERRLRASDDETLKEELDARTRGTLIHDVYELLLCRALGLSMEVERTSYSPASLSRAKSVDNRHMGWALEALADNARWLERRDVTAESRLRDFTGMSHSEWLAWLATNSDVHTLGGRLGAMIAAEEQLSDACVIALEWPLSDDSTQASLDLTGSSLSPIEINGSIDRVDLVPFDAAATKWSDELGDSTIAPIGGVAPFRVDGIHGEDSEPSEHSEPGERVEESGSDHGETSERVEGGGELDEEESNWRPRRLVLIRDMKTKEVSSGGNKHFQSIYDDLQLAIYARVWEIRHPGDLVIGVGVSEIGLTTTHHVEFDSRWREHIAALNLGTETKTLDLMHRLPTESAPTIVQSANATTDRSEDDSTSSSNSMDSQHDSDSGENNGTSATNGGPAGGPAGGPTGGPTGEPFRAWLYHQIHIALSVAAGAKDGRVIPTPGYACSFCSVKSICGLDTVLGGWQS